MCLDSHQRNIQVSIWPPYTITPCNAIIWVRMTSHPDKGRDSSVHLSDEDHVMVSTSGAWLWSSKAPVSPRRLQEEPDLSSCQFNISGDFKWLWTILGLTIMGRGPTITMTYEIRTIRIAITKSIKVGKNEHLVLFVLRNILNKCYRGVLFSCSSWSIHWTNKSFIHFARHESK